MLLLAIVVLPSRVVADDASEAQLNFELGQELYAQRRFPEAVERFIASNRLVPNANVVFNIAQTYEVMERPREAYNWYETYLRDHDVPPDERAEGRERQARLAPSLAILDVETDPPGAELYVDRRDLGSVGVSPRRIAVRPGPRRILATLPEHEDAETEVEAEDGRVVPTTLALRQLVGTLRVDTEPPGSSVRVDGEDVGEAPLVLTLSVGTHRLAVAQDGWLSEEQDVAIEVDGDASLRVELRRDPETIAGLRVRGAPRGARVTFDGEALGEVPLYEPALRPREEGALRVEAPGHEALELRLVLEAGAVTRVDVDLHDHRSDPWAAGPFVAYGAGGLVLLGGVFTAVAARGARAQFFEDPSRDQLDRVHAMNVAADVLMGVGLVTLVGVLIWHLVRSTPPASSARVEVDR